MSDYDVTYESIDLDKSPTKWAVCLYGGWGQWKTTTACSLATERGLLISADNSWKVLWKDIHEEVRKKIVKVEYEGLSQLDVLDYEEYDTVILDPVSEMTDQYVDLLLEHATWGGKGFREKITSKDPELKSIEIPALMDYRVTRDQFRPIVSRLFKLPVNLVFTAHENNPMPGMGDSKIRPAIPWGVYSIIARNVDAIGRMKVISRGCEVSLKSTDNSFDAKSRISNLDGTVPVNTFVQRVKEWHQ